MPYSDAKWEHLYGRSETPPSAEEREWNNRFRHLLVLFGDAAAAVVVRATDEAERGVVDVIVRSDGADFEKLYVPGLRRAGDLGTAAEVAGDALVIHGAGERFALPNVKIARDRLDAAGIVQRLKSRR